MKNEKRRDREMEREKMRMLLLMQTKCCHLEIQIDGSKGRKTNRKKKNGQKRKISLRQKYNNLTFFK